MSEKELSSETKEAESSTRDPQGDNSKTNQEKAKKKAPFANLKRKQRDRCPAPDSKRYRRNETKPPQTIPHEGSFANPKVRKTLGISIPELENGDNGDNSNAAQASMSRKEMGVAKRKVAILLGYLGSRYGGFQMNPHHRTIQAELEYGLFKAGFLTRSNFGFPHKYSWSTSGRTDKGVHACAQVISLKVEWKNLLKDEQEAITLLNQHLPPDIRVLDIKKTVRNFCAKTQRSRVRYQYMIPSFVFVDPTHLKQMFERTLTIQQRQQRQGDENDVDVDDHVDNVVVSLSKRKPQEPLSLEEVKRLQQDAVVRGYRASKQQLEKLQEALQRYVGTKPYHNFTRGMLPDDKAANRFIVSFEAQPPVVINDTEWIPTQVLGQSFLLNQIRKMIGLAVDVVRGVVDLTNMDQALSRQYKMNRIPIAPAQGLFLEKSIYDKYNKRKGNDDLSDLNWMEHEYKDTPPVQRWRAFKQDVVWKHIIQEEQDEGNFLKHLFVQTYIHDVDVAYTPEKWGTETPASTMTTTTTKTEAAPTPTTATPTTKEPPLPSSLEGKAPAGDAKPSQ